MQMKVDRNSVIWEMKLSVTDWEEFREKKKISMLGLQQLSSERHVMFGKMKFP